jgi:hypothetical protein
MAQNLLCWATIPHIFQTKFKKVKHANSFVEQVDDPAMYLSLCGVLWSLGIQYK